MRIFRATYEQLLDGHGTSALLAEYAAECSSPELGAINPQRELYAAMEASGSLQCFAAYSDDLTELMGFAAVLIWTVPHYGARLASTESIFLAAAHRRCGAGEEMRSYLKQFAKEKGCRTFQWTAPVRSRFDTLLSLDDKCRHSNNVYLEAL